jgi:hypothetical protein
VNDCHDINLLLSPWTETEKPRKGKSTGFLVAQAQRDLFQFFNVSARNSVKRFQDFVRSFLITVSTENGKRMLGPTVGDHFGGKKGDRGPENTGINELAQPDPTLVSYFLPASTWVCSWKRLG